MAANESEASGLDSQQPEPDRKVAKTMLEQELPPAPAKVAKTMLEQKLPTRRVARTMLETELPEDLSTQPEILQPKRKVAKTLIDHGINESDVLEASQANQNVEPVNIDKTTEAKFTNNDRVAKTLIEYSFEDANENLSAPAVFNEFDTPQSELPAPTAHPKTNRPTRSENFVAKTMLDHSLLFDAIAKSSAKKEQKAAEVAREKANEPTKPFIEITNFKMATPCSWVWDDPDSREKFRYCGQCKAPVYNFAGMELPEAEALIFKRENREKAPLFKRADGKFMTGNCPLQTKRKRDRIMLIAGAVAVAVSFVVLIATMPPPKPQAQAPLQTQETQEAQQPQPPKSVSTSKTVDKPVPVRQKTDGSFHWEAGQPIPAETPVVTPSPVTPIYKAPDPDENGQFWQYSNGQDKPLPGQVDAQRPVLPGR